MNADCSSNAEDLRFEFGKNWARFLENLNNARVDAARHSLTEWLGDAGWEGMRFLDVGCGSGLFSLAAHQLGAEVYSFDADDDAVACAKQLKAGFAAGAANWQIQRLSVLDTASLAAIGQHDIVYAWGVLHHTGQLWSALDNAANAVKSRGRLFIAIYNDQGWQSRCWRAVKQVYNRTPESLRWLLDVPGFVALCGPGLVRDVCRGRPSRAWTDETSRGMSPWYDVIDWLGGYPFEVAKPDEVVEFCNARGFVLKKLKTCGRRLGCNEYLFMRFADEP